MLLMVTTESFFLIQLSVACPSLAVKEMGLIPCRLSSKHRLDQICILDVYDKFLQGGIVFTIQHLGKNNWHILISNAIMA